MEGIDRELEARVWQRVQGGQSCGVISVKPMLLEALEGAVCCREQARSAQGVRRQVLQQLYEQMKWELICLQGIMVLRAEAVPALPQLAPPREPAVRALKRCYHRSLQAAATYKSWTSDPEFGPVFRQLARQRQEHCAKLAWLMGDSSN